MHDNCNRDRPRKPEDALIEEGVALDPAVDEHADYVLLSLVVALERPKVEVRR